MTDSKKNLYTKLLRVAEELSNLAKDGTNQHQNYKYVSMGNAYENIRAAMIKHGVGCLPGVSSLTTWHESIVEVYYEYTLFDADSGESDTRQWLGGAIHTNTKGNPDDKFANRAASCQKYFLMHTFLITGGDDVDIDSGPHDKPANRPYSGTREKINTAPAPAQSRPPAANNPAPAPVAQGDLLDAPAGYQFTQDGKYILADLLTRITTTGVDGIQISKKTHFENAVNKLVYDGTLAPDATPDNVESALRAYYKLKGTD